MGQLLEGGLARGQRATKQGSVKFACAVVPQLALRFILLAAQGKAVVQDAVDKES